MRRPNPRHIARRLSLPAVEALLTPGCVVEDADTFAELLDYDVLREHSHDGELCWHRLTKLGAQVQEELRRLRH